MINVSLAHFIDTLVPGLPENLPTSLVLQHMLNFKTWKAPYSYHENDIFKQLFDEMVLTAQFVWEELCPEQRWSLITRTTPNSHGTPERTSTIRPDAFFYRTSKRYSDSQPYSCYHIAFAVEFKKSANSLDVSPALCVSLTPLNRSQNTSNVVEAMQYIMSIDARRRFVFGITLKNASLRLWYANRSMLVRSKPLDILKVVSISLLVFRHSSEYRTRNAVSRCSYRLRSHQTRIWAWILQSSLWRVLKVAFTTST